MMTEIRAALYTIAVLFGSYAVLTWTLELFNVAAVAGIVASVALIVVEGIRYCDHRPDVQADDEPELWTPPAGRTHCALIFDTVCPDELRATWPAENGAPE